MPLHDLIKRVKVKHLKVNGRKPFARVYDRGNAGIALGYSVAYDPNTNSDGQIQTVSTKARDLHSDIGTILNKALAYTKKGEVEYIPALEVVEMYRKVYGLQEKVEPVLAADDSAQIEDLGLEIKKATINYAGQQAAKRQDVSEKGLPWYGRVSALWPFGKKEKAKKPK